MLCFTASTTNWFAACSQFRTPSPGWLLALGGLIISHLCSASCTGFRCAGCGSASCSRSTSPCPTILRATGRRLSTGHRCVWELTHANARCQPDVQQFRRQDLRSCWNQSVEQFAARPETTGTAMWTLSTVPSRNILTYLLNDRARLSNANDF